jgi:hypothetical protein
MKPITILTLIFTLAFQTSVWAKSPGSEKSRTIVVYRSPSCSCCMKWVEHLKKNHFTVQDIVTDEVQAIKNKYGIPDDLASCHTAVINNYVVEGHVPAEDIVKFLKTDAKVTGISVPGMPRGTPGMESGTKDPYDVITFDRDHRVTVLSKHELK